jgi:hypothetical protein
MPGDDTDARSQRLNQVIADYLKAAEPGKAPDRDALLEQHPDLADDLRSYFAEHDTRRAEQSTVAVETTLQVRRIRSNTQIQCSRTTGNWKRSPRANQRMTFSENRQPPSPGYLQTLA